MSSVGSDFDRPYWADGPRPSADRMPEADIRMATPSYFATLRRPLVGGREFTTADDAKAQRVVIVNEALARATWPGLDALGRTLILDYQRGPYPYLVVGIVKDALYEGPRATSRPEIFIPHAQNPYLVMNVILRTAVDPESVAQTARGYALRVDPDQPVHSITTMADLQGDAVAQDRFGTMLLMLFAVAGLVVAASGVYSVLSYTVLQRRREIAIRMAIGASADRVARLVVIEAGVLAAFGAVVGLVATGAATTLGRALLFGITPFDASSLAAALTIFALVVVAATWLPARRAARVNPVALLRS
jgi:hypothetical protein